MHVTFGGVSALRLETTSYQFSHDAAVAVKARQRWRWRPIGIISTYQ